MTTGYEVRMYADISDIARSLNRIANCMDAAEARARRIDDTIAEMEKEDDHG